jgi:hypothetical protein
VGGIFKMPTPPYTAGQQLYYARLRTPSGKPPVAQVTPATYLRATNSPGKHRIKVAGNNYGLVADETHLHATPAAARDSLVQQIIEKVAELDYQSKQLWSALSEDDRKLIVHWPTSPTINPEVQPMITVQKTAIVENAIVKGVAVLQHHATAKAKRDRTQAALIAARKPTRPQYRCGFVQIPSAAPRPVETELPAKVEVLPLTTEEAIPAPSAITQKPPIHTPLLPPIPSGPAKANIGKKPAGH